MDSSGQGPYHRSLPVGFDAHRTKAMQGLSRPLSEVGEAAPHRDMDIQFPFARAAGKNIVGFSQN